SRTAGSTPPRWRRSRAAAMPIMPWWRRSSPSPARSCHRSGKPPPNKSRATLRNDFHDTAMIRLFACGRRPIIPGAGKVLGEDRRWRGASAERLLKRKFIGRAGRPGLPTVMIEAYNVMQDRITRARLAGDPADVMISPRLGHIGWFDFHRAEEAIQIGAEAAERALGLVDETIEAFG